MAGAIFNEKRISRVLGQTASLHLLLPPRKLTPCAHNNKCDRRFLLTPIALGPGTKRLENTGLLAALHIKDINYASMAMD